jgi:CRP-like cAMP-binding protein
MVGLVETMTFRSVTQRLARMLLDVSTGIGSQVFDLPATHQELASRLGTVREVVSWNLGPFRAQGLTRIQDRQVEIINRVGLQQEAEPQALEGWRKGRKRLHGSDWNARNCRRRIEHFFGVLVAVAGR